MEGTGHRLSRTLPALYPPSMTICQLSPETINRIAAGEVIERPASAVKELVENALDAGASEIESSPRPADFRCIRITDDGHGMGPDDLTLAVERHATSKLADEDLFSIRTLGFRGEALPSIGSVAHLRIASRPRQGGAAHEIVVDRGAKGSPRPASVNTGTCVEVRDLFSATPARLKFLKSERAENDGRRRGGEAPRDGQSACRLLFDHRRADGPEAAAQRSLRGRPLEAARAHHGPRVSRRRAADRR